MAGTELLRGLRGLHFSQYESYKFNDGFENEMYLYNFYFKKKMIHLHPYTSSYNQVSNSLLNLWDPIWSYKFNGEFKNEMCKNCDGDLFISFLFSKRKRKKGIG